MSVFKTSSNLDLNKIVDKDVQSILLPLNVFQYLTLCPKYCIANNYIKPNGFISDFVSLLGTLFFIVLVGSRLYILDACSEFHQLTLFLRFSICYDWIFYSIGFVINFVIGISQSKNAINFVLTFQNVHRFLNNDINTKHFIVWNWIIVIGFLFSYVFFFTCSNIYLKLPYYYIYYSYTVISFDINVIYAIRILRLLKYKVFLWETKALSSLKARRGLLGDDNSKEMFKAYVNILECYNVYKKCFQHYFLYYVIEIFTHALMYMETYIEMFAGASSILKKSMPVLTTLTILTWLIKDLMWLTLLCHQCEKFYIEIQSVQDICTLILKTNCSDANKRLYKNVQRLHRASFTKIRACGLFHMDAASQLALMSHLANYFIVLLQFAVL